MHMQDAYFSEFRKKNGQLMYRIKLIFNKFRD